MDVDDYENFALNALNVAEKSLIIYISPLKGGEL
jgi:hypothetical protein